jgi:alpha-tubulin suppressor-like RCC1 family protein
MSRLSVCADRGCRALVIWFWLVARRGATAAWRGRWCVAFAAAVTLAGCSSRGGDEEAENLRITAQPVAVEIAQGQDASFSVQAAGPGTLTYQWRRNGVVLAGANAPRYTQMAADLTDDGARYDVVVTSGTGSVTSQTAALSVVPSVPVVTQQPADVMVQSGQPATFTVTAKGAGVLVYQWLRDGVAIEGAAQNTLTVTATAADNDTGYSVQVSNANGMVNSTVAALSVQDGVVAPTILQAPAAQSTVVGQGATFSVVATGTAPLNYQWRRDGVAVAGATSATYTTAGTTSADNGARYTVVVGNASGVTVESTSAVLSVRAAGPVIAAQPQSLSVLVGRDATFAVTVSASSGVAHQWRRNGVATTGATSRTYTVEHTTFADEGARFDVVLTDADGSIASNVVSLKVVPIGVEQTQMGHWGAITLNADGSMWRIGGYPGNDTGIATSTPSLLRDATGQVVVGYARISIGFDHVLARTADGQVRSFGNHLYGQLGNGLAPSSASYALPQPVLQADGTALTGVRSVHAGHNTSYAVMDDGTVRAWGYASSLGIGQTAAGSQAVPVPVLLPDGTTLSGIVDLATAPAADHALALRDDGTLWVWGGHTCTDIRLNCMTGNGTANRGPYALQVRDGSGQAVLRPRAWAAGGGFTVVVQEDGTVLVWGQNSYGQLGNGTVVSAGSAALLRWADGTVMDNVIGASAGESHTVLVRADGTVWAFGRGYFGVIGDSTLVNRSHATQVLDAAGQPLTGIHAVQSGTSTNVATRTDGTYWAWGYNTKCAVTSCTVTTGAVTRATQLTGFAP